MSRNLIFSSAVIMSVLVLFFAGCGPQEQSVDVALKFSEGVTPYKSVSETIQDYKFEQPSINKVKAEQNKSVVTVTFDQSITSVKEDGSADAEITIKGLSVHMKDREGVRMDFDSSREKDKGQPLSKIVGAAYTINISSDGTVKVLDTASAKKAVSGGLSAKIAGKILSDDNIIERHSLPMPEKSAANIAQGGSFSKVVSSPPRTIDPKAFEKVYTLESVDGEGVATIKMSALPSDKPVETPNEQSGFGFMAKMFDTQESWEGKIVLDTKTGQLIGMDEVFKAVYIATDTKNSDGNPDTLTMGLTYFVSLEKL